LVLSLVNFLILRFAEPIKKKKLNENKKGETEDDVG